MPNKKGVTEFPNIPDAINIPTDSRRIGQQDVLPLSIKSRLEGIKTYDTVVDLNGLGDFNNIQTALDAGNRVIFIRNGTYSLSTNLDIPANSKLIGENKYGVTVNLNGTKVIKAEGDTPYVTGTVAVTNGSAIVTGTTTLWDANLADDDFIVIETNAYQIDTVDSDTQVTLKFPWNGKAQSGLIYAAGTFVNDVHIENMTVTGQTGLSGFAGAIEITNAVDCSIDEVIIRDNDQTWTYGISLTQCYNSIFSNIDAQSNGFAGVHVSNSSNNIFSNIDTNNNTNGLQFLTANNNVAVNIFASSNDQAGIDLSTSCTDNIISNSNVISNNVNGVRINASTQNIISNCVIRNNTTNGVNIAAVFSDDNRFVGNTIDGNGTDFVDAATHAAPNITASDYPNWIAPTFANSWVNFGGSLSTAGYWLDHNWTVHLRGTIKDGVVDSAAFTLPAGYRPPADYLLSTISNGAVGRVNVTSAGVVTPAAPSNNAWVSLDNLSFQIA